MILRRPRAALAFILVTVLLDMLSLGVIVPVWPKLLLDFNGGSFAGAALTGGLFGTVFAVMQFVVSPIFGTLSDRVGRRPLILLSNLGTAIDYGIMAVAPNLWWLFAARVLSGVTTASITVASAYISDVTEPEKRAGAFGMIGAAFGVGFVVGPAVGGVLGAHDPRLPFWVAGGLSLVNFLYGLLVMPESLAPEHRNSFSWRRANPLGSLTLLRRHRELSGLSTVNFIGYIANESLPQLFVYYTMYAYAWTTRVVGISLAVVGALTVVISAAVVGPVVKRLGERRALILGLFCGATGFMLYGGPPLLFWIAIPISMLWVVASSASQALLTRRVDASEQGELQGAVGMVRSLAMLIGPGLFTGVFAYSIADWHAWKLPSAGWWLGAVLLYASMFLAWRVTSPGDDVHAAVPSVDALESALVAETPLVDGSPR